MARRRASHQTKQTKRYQQEVRALGLRIRQVRTQRGYTLEVAAERMDMDSTHLAKVEAGTINLSLVTLVRIATGLGVRVMDLFA